MTSNKSQGQSLQQIGIYLKSTFFDHGQMYVATSRCGNRSHIKYCIPNNSSGSQHLIEQKKGTFFTGYKERLQLSYWIDCFDIEAILWQHIHTQPSRFIFPIRLWQVYTVVWQSFFKSNIQTYITWYYFIYFNKTRTRASFYKPSLCSGVPHACNKRRYSEYIFVAICTYTLNMQWW